MTKLFSYKTVSCFFLILLFSSAQAATLHPVIKLQQLHQVKAQEENGDEIRVRVSEAYAPHVKTHAVKTAHLLNWRFFKRKGVKNTWLWQGKLDEGDVVDISFDVLEVDRKDSDLIGSVKVELKNIGGTLQSTWINGKNTRKISTNNGVTAFMLEGSGAVYEIRLEAKSI